METLAASEVDEIVLSYATESETPYALLEKLSNELVEIKVIPDYGKYSTFTYSADQECGIPLLHFNQTRKIGVISHSKIMCTNETY